MTVLLQGLPLLLCLALLPGLAAAQAAHETAVKVRLALSLARYAQWPTAATSEPLRLCLAQRNAEVERAFGELDGKQVNGRRIVIQKAPPVQGCDVLYVHASAERGVDLVKACVGSATLTIGDGEGFVAHGGMVELVVVNDAMRFDVSLVAVRQAQMGLASQVLKLARQVKE